LLPFICRLFIRNMQSLLLKATRGGGKEGAKIYVRNLMRPAMEVSLETHFRKASSVESLHVEEQ
jgi:hypothetical protein